MSQTFPCTALPAFLIALFQCLPIGSAKAQFGPAQTLLSEPVLPKLEALDLDSDGDLDLAGYFDGLHFKWAQNSNGQGDLAAFIPLLSAAGVTTYAFGDVDGDGLPDLVFVDASNAVQLSMNLGGGDFAPALVLQTLTGSAGKVILGDLSANGFPEVIISAASNGNSRINVIPNTNGTFGTPYLLPPLIEGVPPTVLLAGDMNGNDGVDIVYVNENNAAIGAMNVNSDGSEWQTEVLFNLFDYQFIDPVLMDIDGDGDLDIAEAHALVVQWADNRINENIPFNAFTVRVVEPMMTAGIGAFAQLGCGEGASVVYVPSDPALPVRWSTYLPETQRFAPRQQLAGVPRGTTVLLADMNSDGKVDLLIGNDDGLHLFMNQIQAPTTQIEVPALDTVCVSGPSIPLPEGLPQGGTWSGTWVTDNIFHRASVGGTATVPLAYTWYEPEGCPVGATTSIRVITGPTIQPFLGSFVCSGDGPFQMSSIPEASEWYGLSEGNILDLAQYDGEQIVAAYTDGTGATCVSFMGPLSIWSSVPVAIVPAGPFCINDDVQTIVPELEWPNNTWSGDIAGTSGSNALFDPSQGAGTYTIVLNRMPAGPQQCANSDSITIIVSDDIPEITVIQPAAYCASASAIDLDMATPTGGTWTGPGVSGDVLLPFIAGPGTHQLTYTYQEEEGCSTTEQISITLAGTVEITTEHGGPLSFCIDDDPITFNVQPEGGVWSAPVEADGTFDPSAAGPGVYDLVYVYTDPDDCMLVNAPATITVNEEPTTVLVEPVGLLCLNHDPVEITGTPSGVWSGAVTGIGTSVIFDPAALGVGIWPVSLTAEVEGFCPATTTVDVEVEICTGLLDMASIPAISVNPNPTTGPISIHLDLDGPVLVDLLDATGRTVERIMHNTVGPATLTADLSALANGLYHLRFIQNGKPIHVKVLKAD